MSKYFTSVYKNYLEKIDSNRDIDVKCNDLVDKMSLLNTSLNNYVNAIDNSSWNETGKKEILNSYVIKTRNNTKILSNGVINNLSKVVNLVKNDLYDLLVELRDKDEEYCKLQDKIKLEQLDSSDLEYSRGKLKAMDTILVNLVKNIDNKIIEIKKYNNLDESISDNTYSFNSMDLSATREELLALYNMTHNSQDDNSILGKLKAQVEQNKLKKMFGGISNKKEETKTDVQKDTSSNINELDNSNCLDLSLLDENWKVVNTQIPISEYATLAYNKGIRQNSDSSRYGDLCLAFSYVHASNMYNGYTGDNAESAYNWKHAGEFTDYFNDSKTETLQTVYNEVKEGRPVIMQVNGNKTGTSRHFVTVVGVKSDVKSASEVQESDLLILDSWDGKLERMDTSTSRFMTTGAQTNKSYSGYYLRILK